MEKHSLSPGEQAGAARQVEWEHLAEITIEEEPSQAPTTVHEIPPSPRGSGYK